MDKHPINDLMGTVMEKLRNIADVSTVIGESITTPDGITIIPVSRVSMGFGSGGSDFTGKHQKDGAANPFGGGCGGGVKIDPIAFVIIKDGTVTPNLTQAINEVKAGKIEYRLDKTNIIHCPIGKVSFGPEKLQENYDALIGAIVKAKPAAAKGQYIRSCVTATTMGPGIKVNAQKAL